MALSVSAVTAFLFSIVTYFQGSLYDEAHRPIDTTKFLHEYDFIVVGAGSAGSVVASRLSEISNWNVLLLEAGADETILTDVPKLFPILQQTDVDWNYTFVPQKNSFLACNDNRSILPRGKVLGGSSTINGMVYMRGNKQNYNNWVAAGNDGWDYETVLKYFKKSEDLKHLDGADLGFHGFGGPLTVDRPKFETPLADAFVKAANELGFPTIDVTGEHGIGFSKILNTWRNGKRCSSSKAFLVPNRNRTNLHISLNSQVTKIRIDKASKTATGVTFVKDGKYYSISATKEVILSAGVIGSPQILMLSGVGPAAELEKHNIPIIQDLDVGKNLQDHVGTLALTFAINQTITLPTNIDVENILQYGAKNEGFLTSAVLEASGFIKTKFANSNKDVPDMQYFLVPSGIYFDNGSDFNIREDVFQQVYAPIVNNNTFNIYTALLHPKSTGEVTLNSSSPFDKPLIDPKYYSNDEDIKVMVEGIKFGLQLGEAQAFAEFNATYTAFNIPACVNFTLFSDDFFGCLAREVTVTNYHYVGTCKMGPSSDKTAVVDNKLRVHGIDKLRVIDGSIMPTIVGGNTNAPIIMIGERGADLVKETYENVLPKNGLSKLLLKILNFIL